LTQGRFIADPFSVVPGARLYKTGDLARYLHDGNILFLGRSDHQVKIRGYRIELEEIESVLSQYPGLLQAVVIAREDIPGDKRLVAYGIASGQMTLSMSELRSFLAKKLPEYMLPSAFVLLEALPLTPNGKVNRKALPAPEHSDDSRTYLAPRTPAEEVLAGIWADVLHLERVGVHDNFFELGGHSLLATQVTSRVRQAFQVELPVRTLFEVPAIAELAELLTTILLATQVLQTASNPQAEEWEKVEL
jgi:acyl carrier protein